MWSLSLSKSVWLLTLLWLLALTSSMFDTSCTVTPKFDIFSIFFPNIYLLAREGENYGNTNKKSISFNCSRQNLMFGLLALHVYGTQVVWACLSKQETTTQDFMLFWTKYKPYYQNAVLLLRKQHLCKKDELIQINNKSWFLTSQLTPLLTWFVSTQTMKD